MRCLARLDLRGATVALHLIVPPLALLAWSWLLTTGISAVTWWTGSGSAPLLVALLSGGLASLVVWRAVARFIGWRTAWSRLSRMPGYVFRKAPMYARYLWDRERRWRRTDRDRSA